MHFLKIHFLRCIIAVGCVKNDTHLGAYTKCRQFSQCTQYSREFTSVYWPMLSTGVPHFDVFGKTSKQFFLIQIYNLYFFCGGYNCKDIKHLNNISRCIETIENIIQSIIYKIIYLEPHIFASEGIWTWT